ncbi:hypothetical protein SAMN04487897_1771 [Paenibacillus sp. yr247]|nr:hypothetical protein SAMN04487897_1771 [Paenibacillus sp. yr247]
MLGGVFFAYESLKDAIKHVKSYRDEKADKKLLRWYLEWALIILYLLFSKHARRSSLIFALFFFSFGAIVSVITTIRGLAQIFGF